MTERSSPATALGLTANPFHATPQQRVSLARQRYFEEGVRPSGLVSEAVIQSWSRCLQARRDPLEAIAFNPVTASRVQSALARSRLLLETAAGEMSQLCNVLSGTACTVLLTDPQGVVVHASWAGAHADERLIPLARRIGVNLSEDAIGTNGPGLTARTGQASVVLGAEHFFGGVQVMHCAAAPIRDVHGRVAGVLDVSSESRPFGFDAAALVGMYATAIENRLLRAQSTEHVVLHLQTAPGLIDTPLEGLVGIAADGTIAWINSAGARLLGVAQTGPARRAEEVLGCKVDALVALTRLDDSRPHPLPNGLAVWVRARMHSRDGARRLFKLDTAAPAEAAPASPPPAAAASIALPAAATLRDADRDLVERTVRACGGNVAKAARQLGVSRGLVYRHLKRNGSA